MKTSVFRTRLPLFALICLLTSPLMLARSAWAYFSGRTPSPGIELKAKPSPDSDTIKVLPQGTPFNAADKPYNGYYHIRTATDLGWVKAESIGRSTYQQPRTRQRYRGRSRYRYARRRMHPMQRRFAAKLFLDMNFVSPSSVNSAIGSTDFNTETSFGLEGLWFFNPRWALGLRLDYFSTGVSGTANAGSSNEANVSFSLSSLPIMVGIEHPFYGRANHGFYLNGGLFAGLAPTTFKVENQTKSTNGTYSATPFTFLAKAEGGYWVASWASIYGEVGYRILSTGDLTVSGNPDPITQSTVQVSLSSPFIGIGVRASF